VPSMSNKTAGAAGPTDSAMTMPVLSAGDGAISWVLGTHQRIRKLRRSLAQRHAVDCAVPIWGNRRVQEQTPVKEQAVGELVPRFTRLIAGSFTALAGADFLQLAYAMAQQSAEG
jgi:hypothetical protein